MALLSNKEIREMIKKEKIKKKKKKTKSVKKAFYVLMAWALIMQTYVLIMIAKLQDTTSLSIVAGVVFGEILAFYLGFLNYEKSIDLMHMDKNYITDYDDEKGLK